MAGRAVSTDGIEVKGKRIDEVAQKFEWRLSIQDIFRQAGIDGITIPEEECYSCCSGCIPILTALTGVIIKDIGTKLGDHFEAFPAFGVCEPPEFDKKHF